ncbi:MAG: NAD(P)-dependent oxidoreductase [bacterium]|nr:NAD(P)-dependent oxidoreductase [bacterium]MDZ4299410.1 NAD(P)-dependent oxidoreductase [Candidatus Sungbacteria bacterium]
MRVLLFGGTGQLGSELLAQGTSKGWTIHAPSVDEVDIQNVEAIKRIIAGAPPDLIINAAGYHGLASAEREPQKALAINFIAVANIAILAQTYQIPFITYSTGYVFAGDKGDCYEEDDVPCPINAYGRSKYMGELLARRSAPQLATVIRTSVLFGGESFLLKILKKNKNKVKVSDEQIISPTYAKHLAAGTIQLIEKKAPAAIYHLVSEGACSLAYLAMETIKLSGSSTKIIPVNSRGYRKGVHRPLNSSLRNVRARSLGVMFPSWQGALKEYLKSLS